ncbi:transmembrane protein, putative (macronuclear) [Tetrahymena thermophila SB210]|uniref:Transmembrane protein, putative n=1 Tax=Tetrahymena thermophila (strain SB210) TaxID=312017 RepID=W7XDD8_TETTS|nr:transmembrane protein, putative [Tetrahymena thermophila SB210]EWS74658.1 transmembrane protein, putative [Tetrahymena thermophila SB210]|eukprot:XP_012652810.1 transmembrane protein, putative [Tetrahymena thermophila SB210]
MFVFFICFFFVFLNQRNTNSHLRKRSYFHIKFYFNFQNLKCKEIRIGCGSLSVLVENVVIDAGQLQILCLEVLLIYVLVNIMRNIIISLLPWSLIICNILRLNLLYGYRILIIYNILIRSRLELNLIIYVILLRWRGVLLSLPIKILLVESCIRNEAIVINIILSLYSILRKYIRSHHINQLGISLQLIRRKK